MHAVYRALIQVPHELLAGLILIQKIGAGLVHARLPSGVVLHAPHRAPERADQVLFLSESRPGVLNKGFFNVHGLYEVWALQLSVLVREVLQDLIYTIGVEVMGGGALHTA